MKFLQEQYTEGTLTRMSNIITLTELDGQVQAATCGDYMAQTWPGEDFVLTALQSAIDADFKAENERECLRL